MDHQTARKKVTYKEVTYDVFCEKRLMYKEITLQYERRLNDHDLLAIKAFNDAFRKDEIHLKANGNRVLILLREIDIQLLKSASSDLSDRTDKSIFSDVCTSIEQIKSYGLKGRKRHYVGYNKERKVLGRKGKEAKRGQHYYTRNHAFSKQVNALPDALSIRLSQATVRRFFKTFQTILSI